MGFSSRLREATAGAHASAESEGALTALLRLDDADRDGFLQLHVALMTQLHFVYAALERTGDELRHDPVVAGFADDALNRLPSLRADLEHLGAPFDETATPLASTRRYVERLQIAGRAGTPQFVAHHYTRYLGDLSGGLAVGAKVRRTLELDGPDGARFFVFDGLVPATFKAGYRQSLDDAPWDDLEQQRMIDEVLVAYELNTALQVEVLRTVRAAA